MTSTFIGHSRSCLGLLGPFLGLLLVGFAPPRKSDRPLPVAQNAKRGARAAKGALKRTSPRPDPVEQARLDEAVTLLDTGAHVEAAARLAPLADSGRPEARYHFAKSLYRLGFLHAALSEFETVLIDGPDGRFFRSSLEWCLFIGRKMVDDVSVNETLVRYGGGRFPERYRDEFIFRLARHHYIQALFKESAQTAPVAPSPPPPAKDGISFDEDLFGDAPVSKESRAGPTSAPREKDGGISFGADLFGDEPGAPKRPTKRSRSKKKRRRRAPVDPATMTPAQHREAARRLVLRVPESSPFFARAKFVEGILSVRARRENDALAAFKAVVEDTGQVPGGERSEARRLRLRLRELAFFQLARLHFGAGQPSFSIFYYRKIDRDSRQWLDALYESSWAEYRLGRYERALGNLLTVHAPFFEDSYYPESLILKAVIYYENCRYDEAGRIIDDFLQQYEPVFEVLRSMAGEERSPNGWYDLLAELGQTKDQKADRPLLARILEIALQDPEVRRLDASIREVDQEREDLQQARGRAPLAGVARFESLVQRLIALRSELQMAAGRAVERKLRTEAEAVKTLVSQALRVQVETAKAEESRLEASLSRRDQRPKDAAQTIVNWTDDEKLVWPFEGEYWRDELGTYELTLARSCR